MATKSPSAYDNTPMYAPPPDLPAKPRTRASRVRVQVKVTVRVDIGDIEALLDGMKKRGDDHPIIRDLEEARDALMGNRAY